jgi:hypothetical protein
MIKLAFYYYYLKLRYVFVIYQLQTFSEHEYLDGYTTMLGLDGIVNMEKIYKVQAVLEELSNFHRHYFDRKTYSSK